MRNPSSPLRRVLAVVLSLLILPWQQPALALAETGPSGPVLNGVPLDSPRAPLDALDRRLEALAVRIKSDDVSDPAKPAELPARLLELKAAYKAAQDAYVEAERQAPPAAKPSLKALSAPSTGQLIADALVETDLAGIRKDLAALLVLEKSLSRAPSAIPEAEWPEVEKAAPDFRAGLRPLSARVERARAVPRFNVAELEDAYRPLATALDAAYQNLNARASRMNIDGLLAAKPASVSGDAAGALTAELRTALGDKADPARLAAVNARLAGYLRSGNQADLTRAMGEMDLLFDAAGVKDKNARADFFERIGKAAQEQAARPAAPEAGAVPGPDAPSAINSNGVRRETDMASMRRLDGVRLELDQTKTLTGPRPDKALADALASWWAKGREASGPAWEALRALLPEADGSADPVEFARQFALSALAPSMFADADPAALAERLGSSGGSWLERAGSLRAESRREADAAARISARERDASVAESRRLVGLVRSRAYAPNPDPDKPWGELDPAVLSRVRDDVAAHGRRAYSEALSGEDRAIVDAEWNAARAAWSAQVAALYDAVVTEITVVVRQTREADGADAPAAAKRWLRAVDALLGSGASWAKLEAFWSQSGEQAGADAKAARDRAVDAVALMRALIGAQTPPTALSRELREKMLDADGRLQPFGQAVVASHSSKVEKARKMGAFLQTLSEALASGKSDADAAAALKAAFDGNADILTPGDDLVALSSGLLQAPPQGDPQALRVFAARRGAMTAAVGLLRAEGGGEDAPLTRGFAQYNAFLYAHLLALPPDGPDAAALSEPGLAAKRDAFLAAYRDSAAGLSDEPPRSGQVSLARLAREIAEKLPSLAAKRDAAAAQGEFLSALEKLSPERREALVADQAKLEADAAAVARVMRRAEALKAQADKIERARLRVQAGERGAQAEFDAAVAEQRRIFDGDGGPAAAAALAGYRVAGAPDGDWAGVRAEILRRIEEKKSEIAVFDSARDGLTRALAGMTSESGDGRSMSYDEVRLRARRQGEWALVRDARAVMGSLAHYQNPENAARLRADSAALRDESLRRLYYGDYRPAAATRLLDMAAAGELDAARMVEAVSGVVDPRLVNKAFLERAKLLSAKSRAERAALTSHDQEVLAAWEGYKRILLDLAGSEGRRNAAAAEWADMLADRDASHWTDAALTPERRRFLAEAVQTTPEKWRENLAYLATERGRSSDMARSFDAQVRAWREPSSSGNASLYARGAELSDPALTLRALAAAVAEIKSRDASWVPGFTVLDEGWARGLLSQTDPRAAVGDWVKGLVDGQRERLFDTTFRQDQDYVDKLVGERLTAYVESNAQAGSGTRLAEIAAAYARKKSAETALAAHDDATQLAGRLLFMARGQLSGEVLRAWENKRLPEVVLAGGERDPDFAPFLNDPKVTSLRRVRTDLSGSAVFDAATGGLTAAAGPVVGVAMIRTDEGMRTLTVHSSDGRGTVVHSEAKDYGWTTVMNGDKTYYRRASDGRIFERSSTGELTRVANPPPMQSVYRTVRYEGVDAQGRPIMVQSGSYAVAEGAGPSLSGGRELNRTIIGRDGAMTSYDFVGHSQFVAKSDGTAVSYSLSDDNAGRAANQAATLLRKDRVTGEYAVEARRYLREVYDDKGKKIEGRMQAAFERNEGSGLWSVHLGATRVTEDWTAARFDSAAGAASARRTPDTMYLIAPEKPVDDERARLLASATAAKVERLLPMGEKGRPVTNLTSAFIADQLIAHSAALSSARKPGEKAELSISFDGAARDGQARMMSASMTTWVQDAAGRLQKRSTSVLAQYQSLKDENDGNRGGLVLFDGGVMRGIYVSDGAGGARYMAARVVTRNRSDTGWGSVGAFFTGDKSYEQTVFGDGRSGGFKLKEVDVTRPPRETGSYGLFAIMMGAPIADAASIAAEEIALWAGASPRTAKIIGAVVGAGADLVLGIVTMGPAVVKLIEAAGKYGKLLKIGLDLYFGIEGVVGGVQSYRAIRDAKTDQQFADALRGLLGATLNIGMIGYIHLKTRPKAHGTETGREIKTPDAPDAPPADPNLKAAANEKIPTDGAAPADGKAPPPPPADGKAPAPPPADGKAPAPPPADGKAPAPPPAEGKPPTSPPAEGLPPAAPPAEGLPPAAPAAPAVPVPGRGLPARFGSMMQAGRDFVARLTGDTRSDPGGAPAPGGTKASANAAGSAEGGANRAAFGSDAGKPPPAAVAEAAKVPPPAEAAGKPPPPAEAGLKPPPAAEAVAKTGEAQSAAEVNAGQAEAAQRIAAAPAEAATLRSAPAETLSRVGSGEAARVAGGAEIQAQTQAAARSAARRARAEPAAEPTAEPAAQSARPRPEKVNEVVEGANRSADASLGEAQLSRAGEAARAAERPAAAAEPAPAEVLAAAETGAGRKNAPRAEPAADPAKVVEPAPADAELLHREAASGEFAASPRRAPKAAQPSTSLAAAAENKLFTATDAVGRGLELLAGKLHASNRAPSAAAPAPAPASLAGRAAAAVTALPRKFLSNVMAEVGEHLRRPPNTAAGAAEAGYRSFGDRPEFARLAENQGGGRLAPGAEITVKVGVDPHNGTLRFGGESGPFVEVRARARENGTFEVLDVGQPQGRVAARAAEHLDWLAERALRADGPPPGVVRGALERMGVTAPDILKDADFAAAARTVEGGRGPLEGYFDPATGKLSFGAAEGRVKVTLEVRPGKDGPEVAGFRVEGASARVEAAAARELSRRLEPGFKVEKMQRALDGLVDSRAARRELAEAFDPAVGRAKLEVSYDPASGKLHAGKGRGLDLVLRFGRDEAGALRLEAVDTPGRAGPLPAALEHNLRVFASRRAIAATPSRLARLADYWRGEDSAKLDANLRRSVEVAETRVRAEALVRRRELLREVREARAESRAAARAARAEPSGALHVELMNAASRAVEAQRAAEFSRADVAAAEGEIAALSRGGRKAIPKLEEAYRELTRAVEARSRAVDAARASPGDPALELAARRAVEVESAASAEFSAARRGSTDGAVDALVRRENARANLKAAAAEEAAALKSLDAALDGARSSDVPVDVRLSLAEGRLAGARRALRMEGAQIEYRRDGVARAIGADGSELARARLLLELGADGARAGRRNVGQDAGRQHCALATAADMYAAKTGAPVETAMKFAEEAVTDRFRAEVRAEGRSDWPAEGARRAQEFLHDTGVNGMSRAQIEWVMNAVAEKAGLRAVALGAADSPFSRLAAGEQLGVILGHAGTGGHMVNLSNWRMVRDPLTGKSEAWLDVADPNTRVLTAGPDGPVYEARVYPMRAADLVPQIRSRLDGSRSGAAYVFEAGAGPRAPPPAPAPAEIAARMGATERVGAGIPVPGTRAPAGFERIPGRTIDPAVLQDGVHSREIMEVAREYGLVYEAGPSNLARMKPGVDHNFVIVRNPNGTIEMTVGRVVSGNSKEVGVKHVALGDGREVIFAGAVRMSPETGRPTLDFNSGTYSQVGLNPRWNPNAQNARALAAHAEAILKTPVDVVNHFDGRLIEFRGRPEGVGAGRPADLAANREVMRGFLESRGSEASLTTPPGEWTARARSLPSAELVRVVGRGSSGPVFEARVGGAEAAVKTYFSPVNRQSWARRMAMFETEVSNYRAMDAALPEGWTPRFKGPVEVGGNPSFATELVRGADSRSVKLSDAAKIPDAAIEQVLSTVERLGRKGLGGSDSPQFMVLTEAQTIGGVRRSAGDVVAVDAGALRPEAGGKWSRPETFAREILVDRMLGERFGPRYPDLTAADLRGVMKPGELSKLYAEADARLANWPRTEISALPEAGVPAPAPRIETVGAAPEAPRRIVRTGASRGDGWSIDGVPARRLSGGAFKEVLIHPRDEGLVVKLFSEIGAKDAASSLSEKRAELRNLQPLTEIGRAPKVVDHGALQFEAPGRGERTTGFVVQERVVGRELGDMLRDPDPAVRSRAMSEARALFDELVANRIKLEDRVKMHENISIGRAAGRGPEKALVLDAGEVSRVAKPGMLDSLLGRPDPLRSYYDSVLRDLATLSRRAEPAVARGRSERVGSAPDPVRYEKYFSVAEIRAAHPEPQGAGVYHDWQHTVKVADMAGEFAAARGLPPSQAKFVSEVALLHDFDPSRAPGMPARVLSTLEALRADFAGTKSLTGEPGRSVLKERFGWDESRMRMAEAMIQRTEFPFGDKHPNPAYAEKSPLARYQEMLEGLSPGDRRFVLREAALLSEYADKSSWYATEDFAGAHKVVEGLVTEINTATGGKAQMNVEKLGTANFLGVIGEPASFVHDMALASRFRVKLKLPSRAEAFAKLPERYGRTFESNLQGFRELDAAIKSGDAAAFDRARAAADLAFETSARREGVGARASLPVESEAAALRRAQQNFSRTPDYPNSPVFVENSRKANDFFNRWLEGREGNVPLREAMEAMHRLYAGKGEIGKGMGGQYMADGAPNNGRAQVTRDYVKRFGLEPNKDGHVDLPGIPKDIQPLFLGSRYFYPDSSVPGMRDTYYRALETQLGRYSELVVRLEALKAADPAGYKSRPEYEALVNQSLDAVADFGRVAAAFRQFRNGNWGLYGPMMNSMVGRLGFEIRHPGYLDILLQGATESSFKPFFREAIRSGREFHTPDRFDPTTGKFREPLAAAPAAVPAPAPAPAAPARAPEPFRGGDLRANVPADIPYSGPITLRLGGEGGQTLQVLSRADLARSMPEVAGSLVDPRITHVLIDPRNPGQLKALRPGDPFELGRATPGRFQINPQVSGRHLRVTALEGGTIRVEDVGSRNGTSVLSGAVAPAAPSQPVLASRTQATRVEFGGKTLEVVTRAELAARFPELIPGMNPALTHFIVDPAAPSQFKALRPGERVVLGTEAPGRFQFGPGVAPRHARITLAESGVYIEDLGGGLRVASAGSPAATGRSDRVGAGFFGSLFGGKPAASSPERGAAAQPARVPVEAGGRPLPPIPERVVLMGAIERPGLYSATLDGRAVRVRVDASPNEGRALQLMAEAGLPANVKVAAARHESPTDVAAFDRMGGGQGGRSSVGLDYGPAKRAAAEGRSTLVVDAVPEGFVALSALRGGQKISQADWQAYADAVTALGRKGLGGELETFVRIGADGRAEFFIAGAREATLKGSLEAVVKTHDAIRAPDGLEARLIASGVLDAPARMPDPRAASNARHQVPQAQALTVELNAKMASLQGPRPPASERAESRRFTSLEEAAAYLRAPGGVHLLAKTSEGLAGDTVRVDVAGQDWYLKRVSKKLGAAIDEGLRGLKPEDRAANELALREIVRRWFSDSYRVAPEAITIEHGGEIWVMTRGAPAAPDPARIAQMTPQQRADYALLRLVFRAEDLNRGNVLFGNDGKPTLIDFEKVIAEPLDPVRVARDADNEIFVKGFPIVSREGFNDPAVYSARAQALRARFADPEFRAELTAVLERSGWSPERRAAYLDAVETNLRNFEANVKPYLDAANRVAAKRREGVGAGRDDVLPEFLKGERVPDALREFAREAASHYRDEWSLSNPDVRRSDGVIGAHEEGMFRRALTEAHGATTMEKPVPGFPGLTYVRYRLYRSDGRGNFLPEFKSEIYEKTLIDGAIWSESHLAELGGRLFGNIGRDGQHKVVYNGVTFIGWIRDGKLKSFGADSWAGQPPLYADVPAARAPVPKKSRP